MLLYIEDKSDGSPPFCLQTVMKKQGTCQVHQQVSLQYFCFLLSISARYRENMFKSDLVLYTVFFLTSDHQ